jgi:hypothetical protein
MTAFDFSRHGMPCPAKELGRIGPFVATQKFRCRANTCSDVVRGWHVIARGAFGHGMPCPYWENA